MDKICHVIMQTHWDREWYYTFEEYRGRLLELADRVIEGLEKNEFSSFVLDGQVAVVDDLFQICEPEIKLKCLQYMKEGRLIVGPWYVLADEFLIHQESIIRNLETGIKKANAYGNCQMVGYLPDTFGHVGQMPQILNMFDIDTSVVWRGITVEQSEFIWKNKDYEVKTLWLFDGYYAPYLYEENYEDLIVKHIEKAKNLSTKNQYVLTNGGDHLMPALVNYSERINAINKSLDDEVTVQFSDFDSFFSARFDEDDKEELPVYSGEMRDNHSSYVLPNVLSSRYPLKLKNSLVEDKMIGFIEPLGALLFNQDKFPAQGLYQNIWENIMLNHPHDSICGCSIDSVHRSMDDRYARLDTDIRMLENRLLHKAGISINQLKNEQVNNQILRRPFEDDEEFLIFNNDIYKGIRSLQGLLTLNMDTAEKFKIDQSIDYIKVEIEGHLYVARINEIDNDMYFESPIDSFPEFKPCVKVHYSIDDLMLKPMSVVKAKLVSAGSFEERCESEQWLVENEKYQVKLDLKGTLTITDRVKNVVYDKVAKVYRELDQGDEYNYSSPEEADYRESLLDETSVKVIDGRILEYTLFIDGPKELSQNRQLPSDDNCISNLYIRVELSERGLIDFKVRLNNKHKDQRLRMSMPMVCDDFYTDSAFEVVKRKGNRKELLHWTKEHEEVPVVVDPSHSMVTFDNGYGFYHRGLHEVQHKDQELHITLLRSVGWLSRADLNVRKIGAGPNEFPTPDAQCLGEHDLFFALDLEDGTLEERSYKAWQYRNPLMQLKGVEYKEHNKSLVWLEGDRLLFSALRKTEETESGFELRVYNIAKEEMTSCVMSDFRLKTVKECGGKEVVTVDNKVDISLKPGQVKTFLVVVE